MAAVEKRSEKFVVGEPVLLSDRKERTYLVTLRDGERLQGKFGYIDAAQLIGEPVGCRVRTSKGEALAAYRPTLEEYVLLMPRAAQIVTPKDIALIVNWADIFPGAIVVEAGLGSGALTLGLLRAVGLEGRVIAFEMRKEFANCGKKNVERWPESLGDRLEVRDRNVHEGLSELCDIDRVVLDLVDPWEALEGAAKALRPGGILISYLPTIRQVDQLVIAILDKREFANPQVVECILRPWVADRVRLRPEQRIVGHTGFLVRCRRRGALIESEESVADEVGS